MASGRSSKVATSMACAATLVLVLLAMAPGVQSAATATIENGMTGSCSFVLYDNTNYVSPTARGLLVSWTFETGASLWFRVSVRSQASDHSVKAATLQTWDRQVNTPNDQSFWKVNETAIYSHKPNEPGVWRFANPWG